MTKVQDPLLSQSHPQPQPTAPLSHPAVEDTALAAMITSVEALESLPEQRRIEIEAAVFRRLIGHLRERSDVQNIDLMNLAGFCRNCLSKWYRSAADDAGVEIEDLVTREHVYGMPYAEWKARHQK